MPKIGTENKRISGQWVPMSIYYNRTKRFYYKEVPTVIKNTAVNFKNEGYATEQELSRAFDEVLKEYHQIIEITSKVIHIRYLVGRQTIWTETSDRSWSKNHGFQDVANIDIKAGVALDYTVYLKKEAEEVSYAEVYTSGAVGYFSKAKIPDSHIEVPYSEKTIAFLDKTMGTLDLLSHQFIDFFRKPNLVELMHSNTLLLESKNQ